MTCIMIFGPPGKEHLARKNPCKKLHLFMDPLHLFAHNLKNYKIAVHLM